MNHLSLYSLTLLLALWCLTGCTDLPTGGNNGPAATLIEITPDHLTIATSDTSRFYVTVMGSDSTVIEKPTVAWSVEDTSILAVNDSGVVRGLREGETAVRATVEDVFAEAGVEVIDRLLIGKATLEKQTDHGAVMVSWLPLGEEQAFAGDGQGYVATDSLGYYEPPQLEDGEWVFTAEYPYYALARDTVPMTNGELQRPLKSLYLTQQLAFEVLLEKTEYSVEDTIWIKFRATNLTSDTLEVISMSYPITSDGYAFCENGEPVLAELADGRLAGYIFEGRGVPAFGYRLLPPGHTQLEPSGELLGQYPLIKLDWLYEYGAIEKGKTYQVFAGYVANWTYPSNYFRRLTAESTPDELLLNFSLYRKLTPVLITIID